MLGSRKNTTLIVVCLLVSFFFSPAKSHVFVYAGCSQEKYTPNSAYEANLNSFLSSVVASSSQDSYDSFAFGNGSSSLDGDGAVFGLYQCRGDLRTTECSRCIESSVNQINLVCPYSYGATLQLDGCLLRYEHMDFLAKPDNGMRHKKCSIKSINNDVELLKRRDDVLGDLVTAVGFKVSSSGLVEGFAECVGDLSSADCGECLGDAVGKMKKLCGSAAAAEVYLAQCYARYWASGYYDFSADPNGDTVGKSIAIIVGVIVGLAVLIVLLSLCRRKD